MGVACSTYEYMVLIERPDGNGPLGKIRSRLEENI
jgi:hypothetical protein